MADLVLKENLKAVLTNLNLPSWVRFSIHAANRALTANQWLCFVLQQLRMKWLHHTGSAVILHVPVPLLYKNLQWGSKLNKNQGLLNTTQQITYILWCKSPTTSQTWWRFLFPLLQNWCLHSKHLKILVAQYMVHDDINILSVICNNE